MPEASTQTEENLAPTRRTLSDASKKKYDLAIQRIKDEDLNIETQPKQVIAWIKTKGGRSAQVLYYSAIKYEVGKLDKPFPLAREYQEELDRLSGIGKEEQKNQELSEKQVSNFVPYTDLLAVQQRLGAKEDKSDADWKDYLIASLYTLTPPVRADYGDVRVVKKRAPDDSKTRTGNELVWGQKGGDYFVFREYKTKGKYGTVEVRVPPALRDVIDGWFTHLGKTPSTLLGRPVTPNDLLNYINRAFRSTKKDIGINLLRHAYIKHHFPQLTTIKQKEELALKMLHSKDKQEEYNSQNV
tara:strand:+ start:84 stop:980 length:897 start_codon:yes stop_codon:yes gene_type:complete